MPQQEIDWNDFNSSVRTFATKSPYFFLMSLEKWKLERTYALADSLKSSVKYEFGVASAIGYKFLRYGVFVEKGVGRGHPIESVKGNSAIVLNASQKGRVSKPWFNPVIDSETEKLGNILVKDIGDIAVKSLRIN